MLNDKWENLSGPGSCALPGSDPTAPSPAGRVMPTGPRRPIGFRRSPSPQRGELPSLPSLRSFLKGPYYTLVKLRRSLCVRGAAESQKEGGGGGARAGWGVGVGGVNPLLAPFKSVRASADSSLANPLTGRGLESVLASLVTAGWFAYLTAGRQAAVRPSGPPLAFPRQIL